MSDANPSSLGMRDQSRTGIFSPTAGSWTNPVRWFINLNRRVAASIERKIPYAREDLYRRYDRTVVECLQRAPKPVVADVGGGRSCSFYELLDRSQNARVVAVDISEEELKANEEVEETRVADVSKGLPFEDGELGLVVSRTLLEHVSDVESFFDHANRVLCEGGFTIHLVPCRNAPFAVVARLVPFPIAKWLLQFLRPETKGTVEFPVFYDKCTNSEMRAALERSGFTVKHTLFSYYQSDYFDAFLPAFLVSALFGQMMSTINAKNLAAYMLVIAEKKTAV